MEQLISQAKKQFDDILAYVQGKAQNQELNIVEKGIFHALLKLGLTLLLVFFQQKGVGYKGKVHIDKKGTKLPYHSTKTRDYQSIFGKIKIPRACYWTKGQHQMYPLDAELNLPQMGYSYVLQEWGAALGAEQPYDKAAHFLENIVGIPLWSSSIETMVRKSSINIEKFYEERQEPSIETEKEILIATIDGKGVVMRKDQVIKKIRKKRLRKMRKIGEKKEKLKDPKKPGKKKMSTVIGVYTIEAQKKTVENFLSKEKKGEERSRPCNKIVQATLEEKAKGAQRLKAEIEKRDPEHKKEGVALVDGEHKLRELIKSYLPWFLIIIDIYHVMEYLWKGAHIFYKEGSEEATNWMTDKLRKLLMGKVEEVIIELKELLKASSKNKREELKKIITYLTNGKTHMRYDIYLAKGYPVGSGVVEGACRNLVKDRLEQCGMHWTITGAEAVLGMRSVQINKMTEVYWTYHIAQERKRLYGMVEGNNQQIELAA